MSSLPHRAVGLAGAGLIVFEASELMWLGFQPLQALMALVAAVVVALALSTPPGGEQRR